MSTKRIMISLALVSLLHPPSFAAKSDNVKVTNREVIYEIRDNGGEPSQVKKTDRTTFLAQRSAASAIAFTYYNDDIKVDKASAPGATPIYQRSDNEDIFYDDARVCLLRVPLEKGKEKESVIQTTSSTPDALSSVNFMPIYDTDAYTVRFSVPQSLSERITFTTANFPESAIVSTETDKKGNVTYSYTILGLKEVSREPLGQSPYLYMPSILVHGMYSDLHSLYTHLHDYTTEDDPGSAAVNATAAQIVQGLATDDEKIAAIAKWVRTNIRYIAVEYGEYGRKPDLPSSVLEKRYGDCKGSANLIKAMLKSQGIDARLAWIGTSDHSRMDWDEHPVPGAGNHMIAAVVRPDTTIFIDGTTTYAGASYLPNSIQGQQAMIEDGDKYMLRRVPVLPPAVNLDKKMEILTITADGLSASTQRQLHGTFCNMYESTYNSVTASKRDKLMRRIIGGDKNSLTLDSINYSRRDPHTDCVDLSYVSFDKSAIKTAGSHVYVNICPLGYMMIETVDSVGRRSCIDAGFARRYEGDSFLKLSDPEAEVQLPEDTSIDTPWFRGTIKYKLDNGIVQCSAWLETAATEAPADKAREWNDAVTFINKSISRRIKINNR